MTPTVRELRLVCDDLSCGHYFVAQLVVIRTVRASAKPNPNVHLPGGDWKVPANDTAPLPANDDKPPAATDADDMTG